MGNYQGGNGGGFRGGNGGGGFRGGNGGGRSNFRGGDRAEVTMHKAVCDECHKSCEVPFRPSGDKPIYCNDCFSSKKGNDDRAPRRDFGDRAPKREYNDRPAQAPFSKPAAGGLSEDMKNQFKEINVKLDRLVTAIEKLTMPKSEVKTVAQVSPFVKVVAKKAVEKKVVAKKVVAKKKTK